jgi:hypothetical protein
MWPGVPQILGVPGTYKFEKSFSPKMHMLIKLTIRFQIVLDHLKYEFNHFFYSKENSFG